MPSQPNYLDARGVLINPDTGLPVPSDTGSVVQATNKSTGVTLRKLSGTITLSNAALAAGAIVSFTLTNPLIMATDVISLQHQAVGTFGAYSINGRCANGSAVISVRNNTAGSLSEAIVLQFAVIKPITG